MTTSTQDGSWSADDVRANAQTWSLEGDAKLLDIMKNLSKKIEKRGNATAHNLHKMQLNLDRAQVALGNTTNRLMSLQNSQFVENRVYDDDETVANATNAPDISKSAMEKPNLIDALQYALDSGVKMMEKYYEKVTFELSDDSEDDEVDETGESSKSVIFRPKDPYRNRPLPHLIGSKDWQEKWHIGLVDSDAEDGSDNGVVDEISESDSSSSPSLASSRSHVPASMSESENSVWGIDTTTVVTATVKRDLFDKIPGKEEGNNNDKPSKSISSPTNADGHLRDELFDRVQQANNSMANTIFRQQTKPTARVIAANLFDSEPPELDESPIAPSTQNIVDRKPVNLFLDDDDDDGFDIFASTKTESAPVSGEAPNAKGETNAIKSINLFEDDEDENDDALFGSSVLVENKPKPSIGNNTTKTSILSSLPPKNALFQNLFDDEPPEDDFDFLTKPNATAIHRKEEIAAGNDSVESNQTENVKIIEPSSKTVTEKTSPKQILSKVNLFDDDDDEDDTFEKIIGTKVEPTKRPEMESKPSAAVQPTAIDDDADSFEKMIGSNAKNLNKKDPLPTFDDELIFDRPIADAVEKPPPISKNLFDEETDLEDPFIDSPASNAPEAFKQPGEFYNDFSETVTVSSAEPVKSQYSYLFNDEPPPDDDIFESVKPKKSIGKDSEFSRKLNVFANAVNVDDKPPKAAVVANKPKKLNIGNFDINVTALLPGAKRTVSNIKSDAVSSNDRTEDENESVPSSTIAKRIDVENADGAGRLKNLTQNRVKLQTRRPSTRRGRQQQYQKSLENMDDTEVDASTDIVDQTVSSNENPQSTPVIEERPMSDEPGPLPIPIEEDARTKATSVEIESEIESIPIKIDEKAQLDAKVVLDPIPQVTAPAKGTHLSFLVDSDGETQEDDDWLSNVIGPTTKIATEPKASQEIVPKNLSMVFSGDKPPPLLQSNSLFGDSDDSEDEYDEFFQTNRNIEKNESKASQQKAPLAFSSDKPPPLQQSNPLLDNLDNSEDDFEESFKTNRYIDKKDDDLLDEPPPLPEVVSTASMQPKKSLFGDESSDDDDLFGFGKIEIKPMAAASEKATSVLNSKKIQSGKLFSDSDGDDDDDLFGSKPKKSSSMVATKPVASNATQNRITKVKASLVTDQDPLADLLK